MFVWQVAWLDEPDPSPTPENPDPKLDASQVLSPLSCCLSACLCPSHVPVSLSLSHQWWKDLTARGGMNKRDWREIRMKSTLKLPEPGDGVVVATALPAVQVLLPTSSSLSLSLSLSLCVSLQI